MTAVPPGADFTPENVVCTGCTRPTPALAEHLFLSDLRRYPTGEVRLYVDGKLVCGAPAAGVVRDIDARLDAIRHDRDRYYAALNARTAGGNDLDAITRERDRLVDVAKRLGAALELVEADLAHDSEARGKRNGEPS